MLKQKRVEFHSAVCYIATLIFVVVAVLCLFGRVATVETFNSIYNNEQHDVKIYTGFSLLSEYVVFYETTQYPVDYQTVCAYCNLITMICAGFMALGVLYGVLSSRQEAFKKSLWFIEIFFIIALITSILGPLQMLSRIISIFDGAGETIKYTFGIIPYITPLVCLVAFIVFKKYMKDGYFRLPGEPQKYGLKKANVEEVTETVYQPEVVSTPVTSEVIEETPAEEVVAEPIAEETTAEEVVEEVPAEEIATEPAANEVVEEPIEETVEEVVAEPATEEVTTEETVAEEPSKKVCSVCGKEIANDSVFCEYCGAKQE